MRGSAIHFTRRNVYIRHVLTHHDYDREARKKAINPTKTSEPSMIGVLHLTAFPQEIMSFEVMLNYTGLIGCECYARGRAAVSHVARANAVCCGKRIGWLSSAWGRA